MHTKEKITTAEEYESNQVTKLNVPENINSLIRCKYCGDLLNKEDTKCGYCMREKRVRILILILTTAAIIATIYLGFMIKLIVYG